MLIAATDRGEQPTGLVDLDVVARAIANADAVIDGYLAGRYALPLTATPDLLAEIADEIAIWKLHPYEPGTKLKADYEAAMRSLRDIAAGTIRLPLAGVEPEGKEGTGVQVSDRERPFTIDNLKGFI